MANFDDVTVSGLLTAFQMQGSNVAQGIALQGPSPEAAVDLGAGTNHNVPLPGYGNPGNCLWAVVAGAGSEVLGGIKTGSVRDGQLLCLVNTGANDWTTAATDSGSDAGNKFSIAVTVAVGTAAFFVNYDGLWYPVVATPVG